jgi:hypothetical protein
MKTNDNTPFKELSHDDNTNNKLRMCQLLKSLNNFNIDLNFAE